MIVVTCISKIRGSNNNIIGYVLEDKAGFRKTINASELKSNIQNGKVRCLNLKLTTDNRLVDCDNGNNSENEISNIVAYKKYMTKAAVIGSPFDFEVDEKQGEITITKARLNGKSFVEIPSFVTRIKPCVLLEEVDDISMLKIVYKGNKLTTLRGVFSDSMGGVIGVLDLSEFNLQGVVDMSRAFSKCLAMEIKVNWKSADSLINISNMFDSCTWLENVDLSELKLRRIRNMSGLFCNCMRLKNINFGNQKFNKENYDISRVFCGCQGLRTIDTKAFSGVSILKAESTFENCISLEKIDLSPMNMYNILYTEKMFRGDESLREIVYGNMNTHAVRNMNYMFEGCRNLEYIDTTNHIIIRSADSVVNLFSGCIKLKEIDLSNWDTKGVYEWYGMFSNCVSLTKIDFARCKTDKASTFENLFDGCVNLKTVILIRCNVPNLRNIKGMFRNCKSIEKINLSSFKAKGVKLFNEAFVGCDSLKYLNTGYMELDSSAVLDLVNIQRLFTKKAERKTELKVVGKDPTILMQSRR